MYNFKTLALTAILATGTLSAIPAQAATGFEKDVTVRVKIADLQTETGLLRVYDTLKRNADNACGVSRANTIFDRKTAQDCANDLLDDFVSDLDDVNLSRLHQDRKVS